MKKTIILLLALTVIISCIFISCAKKADDEPSSNNNADNTADFNDYDTEFGFETEKVTDEKGKVVKDKNNKPKTTEVPVVYKINKKGKTIAVKIDNSGEEVTDKKGKEVTVKTTYVMTTSPKNNDDNNNSNSNNNNNNNNNSNNNNSNNNNNPTQSGNSNNTPTGSAENTEKLTTTTTEAPTATTNKNVPNTSSNEPSADKDANGVPRTGSKGKEVNFSVADQQIIKSMLEVPYLYKSSYENADGVPIGIACHTAVWMAEREGNTKTTCASATVVLNLFKYYGQTVVNFKTKCNSAAGEFNAPITYVKSNDTFEITEYTSKKQNVSITKIEDLGNNYYKVTGKVDNARGIDSVIAIMQKNKLDTSLGFSVKALKWS